ncbi:hypothetical protein GCK72_000834 [Caenorhabditis remanei]|uniref:Tudor domain-containing protein n=1 Tax=Caenorhabditis remanei TaxID=31234 RepID=A0A6A5HP68_CAERE|nr:hypothetical protein GCK72_000834 [Caenorhabditis remanei]KAF1769021.1 hypothetical protein GCK72_000834 [Caenorhabditis remanei]
MVSREQWEDAYHLAERMYMEERSYKQSELNVLEKIICSRYDTIFKYDPYTDEYSFILQELKFEVPVDPHCRKIAEADLENLKINTLKVPFEVPSYVTVTPIYVAPPSTMLIFNHSQPVAEGLEEALQKASPGLTVNPSETEVTPGGEFIFKHKNGKCYRCIVISEVSDERVGESDRRYEVAFLDYCQIVPVKLKTLYMPIDLTLEKYPCALHCVRPLGIASFRSVYLPEYNNDIRTFYNDRTRRRAGVPALIYGKNEDERKLVMDFPSLRGSTFTNSEEIKCILGHQGEARKDPVHLTYHQLMNKEIPELEYPEIEEPEEQEEEIVKEPVVENNNREDDEDDPVDLDDSDADIPSSTMQVTLKTVLDDECPYGKACIEKFMQQARELPPSRKQSESSPLELPPPSLAKKSAPVPQQRNLQEEIPFDARSNASMSSLQSTTINQTASSNPTPQPTVDEQEIEEITPKKVMSKNDSVSSDGWDTPKKSDVKVTSPVKVWRDEFGTTQKPLMKPSAAAPIIRSEEDNQVRTLKSSSPPPPVQRPLTPTPQIVIPAVEPKKSNPFPVPLMNLQTHTPEKYKLSAGFSAKQNEKKFGEMFGNNAEPPSFPAVATIEKNGTHSSLFGQPPVLTDNKDRNSSFIQWKENRVESSARQSQHSSESSFACNTTKRIVKQNEQTDDDNDWGSRTLVPAPDQDANISKASTNQLISKAQDNFQDSENEDGWEVLENTKNQPKDLTITDKIFANVIPIDKAAAMTLSHVVDDENFSRRSVCSGDFGDNEPDLERGADSETIVIVDEFAEVSDTLKQLAIAFITAIRDAAIQKNRPIFSYEMIGMESISQKMTNELDKRFWKIKVNEAKNFDGAFD